MCMYIHTYILVARCASGQTGRGLYLPLALSVITTTKSQQNQYGTQEVYYTFSDQPLADLSWVLPLLWHYSGEDHPSMVHFQQATSSKLN